MGGDFGISETLKTEIHEVTFPAHPLSVAGVTVHGGGTQIATAGPGYDVAGEGAHMVGVSSPIMIAICERRNHHENRCTRRGG